MVYKEKGNIFDTNTYMEKKFDLLTNNKKIEEQAREAYDDLKRKQLMAYLMLLLLQKSNRQFFVPEKDFKINLFGSD